MKDKYGEIFSFKVLFRRVIVISRIDYVEHILSKREIYENLVEQCQIVLVRILGCIAFNFDISAIDDENIHEAFNEMIKCASRFALMSAMPLWLAKILIKFNWKFQRALKIMKDYVMIIVDHAIDRKNERKCLIDLLIESSSNEKNNLTNDEISISILAGFETTSTALSWFIYFMSKYPNIQQKIKDELREYGLTANSTLTYEIIEKFIYVDCVTKEILRFAPIAAGIIREAIDDDILDGYRIRKGDLILIAIQNLHQHPTYWNIDPKLFYPERFLHEDQSPPRYAFITIWWWTSCLYWTRFSHSRIENSYYAFDATCDYSRSWL